MSSYAFKKSDPGVKKRPCLRCDRLILSTPEWRLCKQCRGVLKYDWENKFEGADFGVLYDDKGRKK